MQIDIEFDSCWQNSFLSGDDDKPISKDNKRKFIATTKSKDKKIKKIDKTTVLGVLCRLIGDQRKLHQARASDDYCFKHIEEDISFNVSKDRYDIYTTETVYLTNKDADKIGPSYFLDTIPNDCPWFFSESSAQLWSILYLSVDELLGFILDDKAFIPKLNSANKFNVVQPRGLLHRIDVIQKLDRIETLDKQLYDLQSDRNKIQQKLTKLIDDFEKKKRVTEKAKEKFLCQKSALEEIISELDDGYKSLESNEDLKQFNKKIIMAVNFLDEKYPKLNKKTDKKESAEFISYLQDLKQFNKKIIMEKAFTYEMNLYSASLYIQAERMMREGISMDYVVNNNHKIQGFSKRGFNGVRDFINPMTGNRKQAVGTPFPLIKATGKLEIIIDVDRSKAKEIKNMIENAGVSSFYLGKKGLAYVTSISTREVS